MPWPWNGEPALYPLVPAGGSLGVGPSGLHVLFGSGEGLRSSSSGGPAGDAAGTAVGLLLWATTGSALSRPFCLRVLGFAKGCHLSPFLFLIFMDRMLRWSQGKERVQFWSLMTVSLLFADDIVL